MLSRFEHLSVPAELLNWLEEPTEIWELPFNLLDHVQERTINKEPNRQNLVFGTLQYIFTITHYIPIPLCTILFGIITPCEGMQMHVRMNLLSSSQ
jgi:hypothetical protein